MGSGLYDRQSAHSMISRWGGPALLRRNGVDRPCVVGELDFTPVERQLILSGGRRFLCSALTATGADLDPIPHHELDVLVFKGEVMRILMPPKGPRPDGIPIFFDLSVEYDSAA
jgi:hypothetical protein